MRRPMPWRVLALSMMVLCGVTAIVWNRSKAHAAVPPVATMGAAMTQFGGVGGAEDEQEPPDAPRVYVRVPYSAPEAAAHEKLQRKVDVAFETEMPLGDFLKHLDATLNPTDDDGKPLDNGPPLQFYVDPIGLEECEKTLDSPISIHLKQIPASTALELVLPQLGLAYHVRPDGLVEIEAELSKRSEHQDPMLRILDEIRQLRAEIAELRMQRRGGMGGGGMGGGMGDASAGAGVR